MNETQKYSCSLMVHGSKYIAREKGIVKKIDIGGILFMLANSDVKSFLQDLSIAFKDSSGITGQAINSLFINHFSTDFLAPLFANLISDCIKGEDIPQKVTSLIVSTYVDLVNISKIFLEVLCNGKSLLDSSIEDLTHAGNSLFNGQNIACKIALVDGRAEIAYTFDDFSSLLIFDFITAIDKNINIKKCANCHRYFIPLSRSDEIYCDNIYRDGKTCKQVGYEIKMGNDQILSAYRKAYKTQNAKLHRSTNVEAYKRQYFDPWNAAAKTKRDAVQQGYLSISSYELWLITSAQLLDKAHRGDIPIASFYDWLGDIKEDAESGEHNEADE